MKRELKNIILKYDVAVVGGGFAGMCAAVAAARGGASTVLIHNRPVLGGNASSEIHVASGGASHMGKRKNVREGGVIEEIFLENRYRNTNDSPAVLDLLMWGKLKEQKNLDLFLNTAVIDIEETDNRITGVIAVGLNDEKRYLFNADIFIDCSGDGIVGYLAGAEYMTGRESSSEFGEGGAVPQSDSMTMGNSLLLKWEDTGHPVKYVKPDWAYDFGDKQLGDLTADDEGYWWIEIGGVDYNIISDFSEIEANLKKVVAGIWDYIKNSGKYQAENFDLRWVSTVAGKRESRRFCGDYILTENDLVNSTRFDDAIAYGGWHIDSHQPEKFRHTMRRLEGFPDDSVNDLSVMLQDIYTIPYRCIYSKNIENLMFAGRNISVTHRALASTRVMLTCAILGQAAGTAAAMAALDGSTPRELGIEKINLLQQQLLKDDCFIPGIKNIDPKDYALEAAVECSSYTSGNECGNVINGVSRTVKEESNCWESESLEEKPWISLDLKQAVEIKEIRIYFDSEYSTEIYPTQAKWHRANIVNTHIPESLARDFEITLRLGGKSVKSYSVTDNYMRMFILNLESPLLCDRVTVTVTGTYGAPRARIYEIRLY